MQTLLPTSLRVVEIGDSLSATFCGHLLSQLGAGVTKAEPPSGSSLRELGPFLNTPAGPVAAPFTALNSAKTIVCADHETTDGMLAIRDLVRESDVVIRSGSEVMWATCGLGTDQIRSLAPTAVLGRVTSFGDEGPYCDMVGGELQLQALGGLMNMVGEPGREPLRLGGYQAQYSTGLAMVSGVCLGLFRRAQTGGGSSFAVSALETVSHIEWKSAISYQASGSIVSRGSDGAPAILKARDGFFAFFYRPGDWVKVLQIFDDPRLEAPQFATQSGRDANRAELLEVLNSCTSARTKRELYHQTQSVGMTTGYMATMSDLLQSEQYLARDFFDDIDLGTAGRGRVPGAPWRLARPLEPAGPAS